eukprot:gnl/TRDRNA2_/TRDRNA2_169353_c0_seq1.p1 gnl/TRDRNA2_/TRDRNA2_169353_c0~~gnl/TRDRNA2_/TRDRNA2_169353_c0_seq1.p1  ORF type:complete len:131 (-),score=15.38 gnl/TRDRNA2_/TRDRNA2_169353_c0_seq1:161-553(-)
MSTAKPPEALKDFKDSVVAFITPKKRSANLNEVSSEMQLQQCFSSLMLEIHQLRASLVSGSPPEYISCKDTRNKFSTSPPDKQRSCLPSSPISSPAMSLENTISVQNSPSPKDGVSAHACSEKIRCKTLI